MKDLESGERHSGWCIMSVGARHRGSRYVEERRSKRRGMLGFAGVGMPWVLNMKRRSSVAVGEVKFGRGCPKAASRAGTKSRRTKGLAKSMWRRGKFGRALRLNLRVYWARASKSSSVVCIKSSKLL